VQFWNVRKGVYPPRPDGIVRDAHGGQVTCIVFQEANKSIFASRSLDNSIKVRRSAAHCRA
jgi:hypothetical protein